MVRHGVCVWWRVGGSGSREDRQGGEGAWTGSLGQQGEDGQVVCR